jgi:hypothetical protein
MQNPVKQLRQTVAELQFAQLRIWSEQRVHVVAAELE